MATTFLVPKFNLEGEKIGDFAVTVPKPAKINTDLLAQAVRVYGMNQRQGNASTKTKGEVSGGGRKPWKQKGTGRARQGSIRSPQWRHGGIAHGPRPHVFSASMPKKMMAQAYKMAILDKLLAGKIVILVEPATGSFLKSKTAAIILSKIQITKKVTVFVPSLSGLLARAFRNLATVTVLSNQTVSAYDIIATPFLVVSERVAEKMLTV